MRRGRPQLGSALVARLDINWGEANRLRLILQTLSGEIPSTEAAERLGLTESAFHKLRRRALEGMAAAVRGGSPGRPGKTVPDETAQRIAELERANREMKFQIVGAQLREEIALLRPDARRKKGLSTTKKRKKRGKRG